MIQRREDLRLAVEARQPVSIVDERIGKHFQRDIAMQLRVAGTEYLTHAALAEDGHDFVRTEGGFRSEGQRARL
jgi:hypothetical protein